MILLVLDPEVSRFSGKSLSTWALSDAYGTQTQMALVHTGGTIIRSIRKAETNSGDVRVYDALCVPQLLFISCIHFKMTLARIAG
ncbi:hypothetical protein AV649_03655 [Rossellomorea marisflavi]|uniref:Uncharacterized protein n=1 Tax=Rossellomorea marisflavi TaxID=189381 RepID=A0A163JLN8_9BACI|nr:hypothetical protein VL03_00750 [Rossellomorea marisflavi]KZE45301.1 hypothetical protein AV649_03655 [Rossellomorea marisflavi]